MPKVVTSTKLSNAAEMLSWMMGLKLKVMKWVLNPTHAVERLKEGENANNKWEDF